MGFLESMVKTMKDYADDQKARHDRAAERATTMSDEQLWNAAKRDSSYGGKSAYVKELKKRGY